MVKSVLDSSEFNEYYKRYIDKLSNDTQLRKGFETGKNIVVNFFEGIPEGKLSYRYQAEKWSIKEVLQHMIDTERIFMYRCFRISRQDPAPLVGFDQDIYNAPSKADHKSMEALLAEFDAIRAAFLSLVQSLSKEDLLFIGTASGSQMSARAAAYLVVGHAHWHINIIKERYL